MKKLALTLVLCLTVFVIACANKGDYEDNIVAAIWGVNVFEVDGEMLDTNGKPVTGIVKTYYNNGNI
jgi:hypothetical protein